MIPLELAPLEGVTGWVYRRAFFRIYGGVERCYTPFLSPNLNHSFTTREWNEIDPAHNEGLPVVPQLLTSNSEHFLWACGELKKLGYTRVDLNLGCPSGTVTAKKKGSGLLRYPELLEHFLEESFAGTDLEISIKTRIGYEDPEEFDRLLSIYERFPIARLTVHPRVRKQFYKGTADIAFFKERCADSALPTAYNGDLFTPEQVRSAAEELPFAEALMLGRGLIANPALALEVRGEGTRSLDSLRELEELLLEGYCATLYGDRAVLSRMKELWFYQLTLLENGERFAKPLRKAERLDAYRAVTARIFREGVLRPNGGFVPDR